MKLRIYKGDLLIYGCALLLFLLFLFADFSFVRLGEEGTSATVSTQTEEFRLPLSEDRELTLSSRSYTLKIVVEDGSISVKESDCPGGLCVRTGRIGHAGQQIVCLPAGVVITVWGGEEDADIYVG